MIRRLLLPLSPDDDGSRAVEFTRALARRGPVEVLLLRIEEWPLFGTGSAYAWSPSARTGRLTTVRKAFGPSRATGVRSLSGKSIASAEILEKARRGGISLIVVAYRSESLWNRVFGAPGAQRVLRDSPIPVLAVPEAGGRVPVGVRRILFIHPGGEAAAQGFRMAIEIAQYFEAAVDLLRVCRPAASSTGTWSAWLRTMSTTASIRSSSGPLLGDEDLAGLFQRRGVKARLVSRDAGDPDPVRTFLRGNPVDLAILADSAPAPRESSRRIRLVLEDLRIPLLVCRESHPTEPEDPLPLFQLRI
jgi:nucleotide-binding universal stress UspA family protein